MEAAFPYEETPGQVKAIADVLDDMEAETPMGETKKQIKDKTKIKTRLKMP